MSAILCWRAAEAANSGLPGCGGGESLCPPLGAIVALASLALGTQFEQ